ncbi:LacI family DNA-binding transcriptional regulator [Paenibacillus sp. sgz302251]|uniref:LacI family DNA-binding transcriptional regulator n=1 Tax=Paenibacillus sp. sgz302251 TaxID=3414493 RepID=UPI003C7A8F28
MKGKVTIQEIADHIGLSKYAVSRALSGKSGVSAQTRERIMKTAGQLGYFKDLPGTSVSSELIDLDTRTWSGTILVLFPNVRYQNTDSLYWGPIFNGISARLNQKKINIVTLTEPEDDSMFTLLNPEAIMGIITVGSISSSILFDIKRLGIPVVMVDHLDRSFQSDSIFADNLSAMREMIGVLIRKGFKKYRFVGNIKEAQSFQERWIGCRAELEDAGLDGNAHPIPIGDDLNAFADAMAAVIEQEGLPDAFICVNDISAKFVIEALEGLGVSLPGQVIVTGFDNTHPTIPITATVNVDKELLGKRAVDQILWRILNQSSSYEKKLIQAEVIFRN